MSSIRVTLLNIVAAALLIWAAMEWIGGSLAGSTALYVLVLAALLFVVDQLFRMTLQSLKRIWLIESIFILLSLIVLGIVRYIF